MIRVIGTLGFGLSMVYFTGIIEMAVEILLYLHYVALLAVGFVFGGLT